MQLILTPEIAKELLAIHDDDLTQSLVRHFLDLLPEEASRDYLFSQDVATWLLLQRLEQRPEETLGDLFRLLEGKRVVRERAPVRKLVRKTVLAGARGRRSKKRVRTTAAQTEDLKAKLVDFLRKHPWSSRKQIQGAVKISTAAVYRRILLELKASRQLKQRGTKATSEYALAGTGASAGGSRKKAPKDSIKIAGKKPRKKGAVKQEPRLCPVPGCTNKAAPVFGMMCREHKDLPRRERDRLFAARRAM